MSNLTVKIKHGQNLADFLQKAKLVANYVLEHKGERLTSKHVAHFGLPSALSNQTIRKYGRNKKLKRIRSVKLTVPNQSLKRIDNTIKIVPLKFSIPFSLSVEKINQIELDDVYAYVSYTVNDQPSYDEVGFIGVDRNSTGHIAVVSIDNKIIKLGKSAPHIQRKYKALRRKLQKQKKYKLIKKIKNKQARKSRDVNHKISRKIVDLAKENCYAIKLEKLTGIRNKRQGRKLNGIKSTWSYYQLQQFIEYKAKLLGVKVYYIDPAYTSQTCSRCGLIGTRDKKVFKCEYCKHKDHADANASFNIARASLMHDRLIVDRDTIKSHTGKAQEATF